MLSSESLTYVVQKVSDPQYTRNAESIVFMCQQDYGTQIAKLDIGIKKIKVLTNGMKDSSPSIFLDGKIIVYKLRTLKVMIRVVYL